MYTKQIPTSTEITEIYLASGRDTVLGKMLARYGLDNIDEKNPYLSEYLETFKSWVNASLDYLDVYKNSGCILNGKINYSCINNNNMKDIRSSLDERSERIRVYYSDLIRLYDLNVNFTNNVFIIDTLMGRKNGYILMGSENE